MRASHLSFLVQPVIWLTEKQAQVLLPPGLASGYPLGCKEKTVNCVTGNQSYWICLDPHCVPPLFSPCLCLCNI